MSVITTPERELRCFVAGTDDPDTRLVLRRAREVGFIGLTANDIRPASESPRDAIHREIRSSDVLVAVLPPKARAAASVFFEIGVAVASNTPVLLVTSTPQDVPVGLIDLPRLSSEVVRTHEFEATLRTIARSRRAGPGRSKKRTAWRLTASKASDLEALSPTTELSLASVLADAFRSAGADVAQEAALERSLRADLLVWNDDLSSLAANPLILEVKRDVRPETAWEVAGQVERYLTAANTRLGLVVYLNGPEHPMRPIEIEDRKIAFVQWARLLEMMRREPFPDAIASLSSGKASAADA